MEQGSWSSVGRAFVTGGVTIAVVQAIMELLGLVMPPEAPLALRGAVALVIAGVITGLLFVSGVWAKIDEFGGMGVNLPFIGLVGAVAGIICGARAKGAPTGRAVGESLKVMAVLFGTGFAFGIVVLFVTRALGVGIFA